MTVTAAILLAASDATVDGTLLPLLPWRNDETLVEFQIAQLQAAGVDVIEVVLGAQAADIIPLVARDDVEPIVDPRWQDGEASWLRVGASAVPRDTVAAILARVSQPRSAALCRGLLAAHMRTGADVTRAAHGGVPGWPVVVGRDVLPELRNLGDAGLEALVARHATRLVAAADLIAVSEITSRADLVAAMERWTEA